MLKDPKLIHDALGKLGPVHVYFVEFQLTHWALHLLLTGRDFHDVKAHLFLNCCDFICGKTLSGPATLSMKVQREDNQDVVVLSAPPAGLEVKAIYVSMGYPGEVEWPRLLPNVPEPEL